ncbi:MAG: alpha/beta fold hydrolase [Gammaproteobacteria bacterium]|nr:alpha/beta fold hydrolase [Gammaproteobacteria bacterium]MDE0364545.1 alpha/beta fold hydrolase [Gammaproteobacteria bacterium]
MPSISRSGVEIYFEVNGSGPAILLSHGYAATTAMWKGQLDAFSRNHTLITWDMRGHGQSDSPGSASEYSANHTIEDMAALLDELNIVDATIGGLSLGGYMSLEFHRTFEDRVNALLIIDTGPGFKSDESRNAWNVHANGTADVLSRNGLESLLGRTPEMAQSKHRSLEGLVLAGRHMLTQQNANVIESLPSISKPTLVVVGAEDKPFRNASDYMAKKIPGAKMSVIANAGHAVNIDQPDEFNRVVLDFLSKQGL